MDGTNAAKPTKARLNPFLLIQGQEATLAVFLVLILALLAVVAPTFMDPQNIRDILINASFPAIAAIGMTMVIVSA